MNALIRSAIYIAAAQAKDSPSKVLVPLPISSMRTRLLFVAFCRIVAVSVISTINVERPPAKSSDEPIRVNILSTGPMTALVAGT